MYHGETYGYGDRMPTYNPNTVWCNTLAKMGTCFYNILVIIGASLRIKFIPEISGSHSMTAVIFMPEKRHVSQKQWLSKHHWRQCHALDVWRHIDNLSISWILTTLTYALRLYMVIELNLWATFSFVKHTHVRLFGPCCKFIRIKLTTEIYCWWWCEVDVSFFLLCGL